MATMILEQSGTGNANMQVQLTYTAGAGAINITAIKGRRTDGYDTLGSGSKNRVHITIGDETFTLTPSASDSYYIRFTKNSVWSSAWAGVSASRDDVQGNQKIKITFTCPYTANIANSVFEGTINAGYKTPSMTLTSSAKGLNYVTFKCAYTNSTPEKIQIYNETTGAVAYEGTSLTPTVSGLTRNTAYKFKVRGYANSTWGEYSSSLSITTYKGADVTQVTSGVSNTSPSLNVTYTNDSGSAVTYTLKDTSSKLNKSGTLGASPATITLTSDEMTTLMNGYPNTSKIPLTLTVVTAGITTDTNSDITFNIVDSNPTLGSITYVDTNATTKDITTSDTQIIVGKSTVRLSIPKMATKNGATEGSYTVLVDNVLVKTIAGTGASSYTTDIGTIPKKNSVVQVTATDSRGSSTVVPVSISLYDYSKPIISSKKATRKNLIEEETKLTASGTYTHFSEFDSSNSITKMEYRYTIDSDTLSWSDYKSITTFVDDNAGNWSVTDFSLEGDTEVGFNISNSYLIEFVVSDELGSSSEIVRIKGASPTMWVDKQNKRVGIGKKPTKTLDVAGDTDIDGTLSAGNIYGARIEASGNIVSAGIVKGNMMNTDSGCVGTGSTLSSYWLKVWDATITNRQFNDFSCTLQVNNTYQNQWGTIAFGIRQNGANGSGAYNFSRNLRIISGNFPWDKIRLYYNNSTGYCALWVNVGSQYGCFPYKVLGKNDRTSAEISNIPGTFYNGNYSSVQTLPTSDYITAVNNILTTMYPVGQIYMSVTDSRNPVEILGFGTWSQLQGLALVGAGTYTDANSYSYTFTAGTVSGAYTHTHAMTNHIHARGTLTAPIAIDNSYIYSRWDTTANKNGTKTATWTRNARKPVSGTNSANTASMTEGAPVIGNTGAMLTTAGASSTIYTGSGSSVQPSLPVYMWKRTA